MIQKLSKHWNRFFFEPISPAGLGLFRIVFGVVIFLSILGKFPGREIFYGDHGVISYKTMTHFYPDSWMWFRWIPGQDPGLKLYFLALLAATVSLTLGFWTRISSVLVWAGLMSLSSRNMFVDNSGDDLMRINSYILLFADAGAAYSLDRWLRMRKGNEGPGLKPIAPWPQRLFQLQLAYLYFDTAYLKLGGETWRAGTAMYYAINYIELKRFTMKYFFYYLWQIKLMTYGTVVLEFTAATLVWFRKIRYPIILGAMGLHVGINLTMQFPVFQYVMIASWINFLYPEDVERVISAFLNRGLQHPASALAGNPPGEA